MGDGVEVTLQRKGRKCNLEVRNSIASWRLDHRQSEAGHTRGREGGCSKKDKSPPAMVD